MNKQLKRSLLFALSLLFGQGIMAETLSQLCLRSFEKIKTEANIAVEIDKKGRRILKKLELPKFSDREKIEALFNLSDQQLSQEQVDSLTDLEILYSQGKDKRAHVQGILAPKNMTVFGYTEMARMLANESIDFQTIVRRQKLIRLLLEDEGLYSDFSKMFTELKQHESNILSFWKTQDDLFNEIIEKLYWGSWFPKSSNKSTAALEARTRLGNAASVYGIGSGLFNAVLTTYGTNKIGRAAMRYFIDSDTEISKFMPESNLLDIFKAEIQYWNPIWAWSEGKRIWDINKNTTINRFDSKNFVSLKGGALNLPAELALPYHIMFTIVGTINIAFMLWKFKSKINTIKEIQKITDYLHERLISVGLAVRGVKKIKKSAEKYSELQNGLEHMQIANSLLSKKNGGTRDFVDLIKKLETDTFTGSASFFSVAGRVRAAYKLMEQVKDEFEDVFKLLGELEACLAIATKMKEVDAAGTKAKMCFVEFSKLAQPYFRLQDFWNPFVGAQNVVTNSIELGRIGRNRNMLLTGSNTGGKSTTIKAMMINAWVARFGVAFASRAIMTPFTTLSTSLNIKDDTAAGKSLFKSEVLRAKSIDNQLNALQPNQFGLIVIDELFVGTASAVGEKAAYQFAKQIAKKYPNVIIGFVTHFGKLTELEKETNGVYKNFKQEIFKDANGKLVRPFKLEVGISTHNVAEDILNEDIVDFNF